MKREIGDVISPKLLSQRSSHKSADVPYPSDRPIIIISHQRLIIDRDVILILPESAPRSVRYPSRRPRACSRRAAPYHEENRAN